MRKSILICILLFSVAIGIPVEHSPKITTYPIYNSQYKRMDIGSVPAPSRDIKYRKFLAASIKIVIKNGNSNYYSSGSGTIINYDSYKNLAYVATCGHMWTKGEMSATEGLKINLKCTVVTWYHNSKKLSKPKEYTATVVFWSYRRGADTALITFTPDWEPNFFPIAPLNYKLIPNKIYHSLGCDHSTEVAHFSVQYVDMVDGDIVTIENSPLQGRSGGGLLSDDGWYIGTCWGTERYDGKGKGFFTPLAAIHDVYSKNGYSKLLKLHPSPARRLKIKDRTGSSNKYNEDYILIPKD